jgi:hypothetical protein
MPESCPLMIQFPFGPTVGMAAPPLAPAGPLAEEPVSTPFTNQFPFGPMPSVGVGLVPVAGMPVFMPLMSHVPLGPTEIVGAVPLGPVSPRGPEIGPMLTQRFAMSSKA